MFTITEKFYPTAIKPIQYDSIVVLILVPFTLGVVVDGSIDDNLKVQFEAYMSPLR